MDVITTVKGFQNKYIRILYWLGIMSVLTALAMILWLVLWGDQSTTSLKWLQFLQTIATFLLPPVLCAWLWSEDHKPIAWLKLDKGFSWETALLAIGIMICSTMNLDEAVGLFSNPLDLIILVKEWYLQMI